jgi:HPt (histidine-containing phosphotransfer) domain-containing protein
MSEPTLNPEAIDALRAVSPDDGGQFLTELIDIFLEDTPARLVEFQRCATSGDVATATRAAHSIKGSAGNFGAVPLAKLAAALEATAKSGQLSEALTQLPAVEAEFARVKAALTALRAQ